MRLKLSFLSARFSTAGLSPSEPPMMKLMSAKAAFEKTHPKFVAFLNNAMACSMEEGTIIELTMTRPGEAPITTNIKVQKSDLELVESLRDLAKTEK